MVTKRRWNSFVCPGCRFVFRVPRDHDGQGTVCPSCHVMLRLPAEGEETPPLVRPVAAESVPEEIFDDLAPEEEGGERSSVALLVGMSMIGLSVLVGFAFWLKPRVVDHQPEVVINVPKLPAVKKDPSAKEPPDMTRILKEAEPVVKGFLSAKTVDEALKYVSKPDRTRARWTAWLKGDAYSSQGLSKIDEKSVAVSEELVSIAVTTADYSVRQIALRMESDGLKVDWESWAGWSEMSWADFRSQKPTEAKLFRVIISKVDYYNFGFSNDSDWVSYRLESPDRDQSIFGYAEAASPVAAKVRPMDADSKRPDFLLLRLRFPAGAAADNQVIIEDSIGQGWVEP